MTGRRTGRRLTAILRAAEREHAENEIREGIRTLVEHRAGDGSLWFTEDEVRGIVTEAFEDVTDEIAEEREGELA